MTAVTNQSMEALLHDLFEDDNDFCPQPHAHPDIEGLVHIPGCLSQHQQEALLQQVNTSSWFTTLGSHTSGTAQNSGGCGASVNSSSSNGGNASGSGGRSDQAMVFGVSNMPQWLQQLAGQLPLQQQWPAELASRSPLFDTAIINMYHPGDGITPHVDLLRFADGIAIRSLGDPAIMNFTPGDCELGDELQRQQQQQQQQQQPCCCHEERAKHEQRDAQQQYSQSVLHQCNECCQQCLGQQQEQQQQHAELQHQLLLQGGDLLLLRGAARYCWRHGIAAVTEEVLLCNRCKAAADAAAAGATMQRAVTADSATAAAAASGSSQPDAQQNVLLCGGAQAVQIAGVAACNGEACQACVRVVRGRRVSLTLRRLDAAQSMLNMQ